MNYVTGAGKLVWNGEGWSRIKPATTYDTLREQLAKVPREIIPPWDYRHLLRGPKTVLAPPTSAAGSRSE